MTDPTSRALTLDRERLNAVIEPVVRAHGGEVVDIEWKTEQGGWVLRVTVEKGEGKADPSAAVSLDLCADVARDLSPALDVADIIPHRYSLEVSSPGLERPLKTPRDYERFAGRKAKLRLRELVDGQKVLVGVIEASAEPGSVAVREGSRVRAVSLANVESARLVFELGPAPKPGKARKPGQKPGKRSGIERANEDESRAPSQPVRSARGESDSR
jgi:ribosome maturation factor RimP